MDASLTSPLHAFTYSFPLPLAACKEKEGLGILHIVYVCLPPHSFSIPIFLKISKSC